MSFTVHDLPQEERPRERLIHFGVDSLSAQELLSIILGRGIRGESVMVTSQKILTHFGSLKRVQEASYEDLLTIRGIGPAKACQLLACFSVGKRVNKTKDITSMNNKSNKLKTTEDFAVILQEKIGGFVKEHFVVMSLDSRHELIAMDIVAIGTLNANIVHPREIFEAAIRRHAASILISHNHPSGKPQPSDDDVEVTTNLMAAGKLFGIPVVDHIIVTPTSFFSFQNS